MLKEQGNLITEGIPLTRDLLEFALGNDYKISLRTGDYGKEIPKNRAHYDDNLLTQLYNLYVNGDCYLPQFIGVFDLNVENLRVAFKKRGLGMLSYEERFRLYGKNIFEQSCATQIANRGRVCNFSDPEHHARAIATMIEEYEVDNPSKSPEFQNKKIQTNLRKRNVEWPTQDPEVRAQQIATLIENWKVDNPSKSPELQAKKAVTVENSCGGFGFASPILNPIIRATNLANLGVENPMQNPKIVKKNQRSRADNDPRYEALLNLREMKERGAEIVDAQVIEVAGLFGKSQEINILKEFGVKEPHQYTTEIKIQNLLDSLGVDYIRRARSIHGGKKES
nr:MAG TPA: endonuclease-like protein [Caudoviricetes sp.]